ncbi:hypothetical protein DOY81_015747, partial [Sarcophaga bullata]
IKTNNRRRNRRVRNLRNNEANAVRSGGNEIGAGGDKRQGGASAVNLPDSTTKSPKTQRAKRHTRSYNKNTFKTQTVASMRVDFTETAPNQSNNAPSPASATAAGSS